MPVEVERGPGIGSNDSSRCSNLDLKVVGWYLGLVIGQGHGVVSGLAAATR